MGRPLRRWLTIALAGVTALVAGGALAGLVLARWTPATIELAPLVADGMVLQRQTTVAITGHARAGWPVAVAGSWGAVALTRADDSGAWHVELRTRGAGGPHRLLVWAGDATVVRDVWIGETWLCSGQSNMAMTVAETNAASPILDPPAPHVRLFTVGLAMAETPQRSCTGKWRPSTPETARDFSAICLAFGRTLQGVLGVPIGLVAAAAPGSDVESWTSERALRQIPEIAAEIDAVRDREREASDAAVAQGESEWRPLVALASAPPGDPVIPSGVLSLRAALSVTPELTGDALVLFLPPALTGATVRVNQRELPPGGSKSRAIPADLLAAPELVVQIEHALVAPVGPGVLDGAYLRAGAYAIALPSWEARLDTDSPSHFRQRHSLLFNAMIAPLVPYTLKGVIWYQGEANVPRAAQYGRTFPAMIRDWRAWWGRDLAFGFVQLPPFDGYRPRGAITELRDAQRRTLAVPGTGMVVTIDLGDGKDIHSADKPTIGGRLGAWALSRLYDRPGIVASGPLFRAMRVEPWGVRVSFDHAVGGLRSSDWAVKGFELAGEDRRYRPAAGVLDGDSVMLLRFGIANPIAVRYAWADVPVVSLKNGAGLPASPFRSDDWDGVTADAAWRGWGRKSPP